MPSRVNAPTTYSVSSAKKGDESDIEWRKDKGDPVLVPRKSVNPSFKTSSPIDRQEGSTASQPAKSFSNFRSLNLLVKKELRVQSSELSPIEPADVTFYLSRKGHEFYENRHEILRSNNHR